MLSHEFRPELELYWRNALADSNTTTFPILKLPGQYPLASTTASYHIPISGCVGKHPNIEIPVLIRAAWALVVGCMTNSVDIVFGVPTSEKNPSIYGTTHVVDQETDLVPVRVDWNRDSTIIHFLDFIRQQGVDMAPFERIGIDKIAKISSEARQASEFQSLLIIQTDESGRSQPVFRSWKGQALLLHILYNSEDILVKATFDSAIVKPWEIRGVLEQLGSLVQQLQLSNSTTSLADLQMVTQRNLETLWGWNASPAAPVESCIHTIIEENARLQPNAAAVHAWDGQLTYGQLDQLSNLLARRLTELDVGPKKLIPLCFEKSMWTMVALLGVLKAGCGFVLLDPSLPEGRLRTIVQQTQSRFIVSSIFAQVVSIRLLDRVIIINSDFFINPTGARLPVVRPNPESIMYVVFTSGSTGTPKGAMISHKNFASAMEYQLQHYKVSTQMRMFDFASYSFVASIANLFITLTAGGCVCIPNESDKRNNLVESIMSFGANVVHLTPSAARLLTPDLIPTVELIIFSGESLHVEDIRAWWDKVRVLNVLGLSECAPRSTLNTSAKTPEEATRIGKGVGQLTWVVDPEDHNKLMPIGCIGELLLEGPLVGLGYLNDPNKTEESFIKDPQWLLDGCSTSHPGRHGRLYKTGDLVQYNQDGSLSYIARKDAQVKVRGQRVELGEVEYRMKQALPDIQGVIVDIIKPRGGEGQMLAAFIQLDGTHFSPEANGFIDAKLFLPTASTEEILAKNLPQYMIPSVIFAMSKLPTTATGKIDRRRVRVIGGSFSLQELADMRTAAVPKRRPKTKNETKLRSLWSNILKLEVSSIGLDDTFLQLGGDSLSAMELVSEGRKVGFDLTVAYILSSPTLEEAASKTCDPFQNDAVHVPPFGLVPEDTDLPSLLEDFQRLYGIGKKSVVDIYPCTPLQEGLFSLSMEQGDYIAQRILKLVPGIDIDLFCWAWETVSQEIEILRTRIIPHQHGHLLQVVINEAISFGTVNGLKEYLNIDRENKMEIGQPLTRYALVKDGCGLYSHFVLTIHHALYDGWSMRLLMDSVEKVYHGQALAPQPKFNTFISYITQQDTELAESYWREYLSDYNGVVFPRAPLATRQSSIDSRFKHKISLPPNQNPKATTSSLIRAAWAIVVGFEVEARDVVFGVPVSGRSAPLPDIERLPAPTLATVPVRVQWAKEGKLIELLHSIQKNSLDMIPFEQAGLTLISKVGDGCQRACEFQTLLLIQPNVTSKGETLGKWELKDYQELNTYALTVEVKLATDTIDIYAGFDSRSIETPTIQKLIHRFASVLQILSAAGPDELVSDISFVLEEDLNNIWAWNSNIPRAVESCVDSLIEDQSRIAPFSPAIHAWDAELSYETLDVLSTKLAWKLMDNGSEPGEMIPLCFEKSAWIVVSLLAVVKAGATFVLLDTSLPEQRLRVMVQQIKAKMIISSVDCESLSSRLASKVITVSTNLPSDLENQEKRGLTGPTPDSILYVAFTSGSTGTPKGAMISHRNIASAIYHQRDYYAYRKTSRVFDFASYSFDMSIFAMLFTLASGACLCIPNDEDRKSDLAKSINTLRANTLVLTPSVVRTLQPTQIPCVKTIQWIGEALSVQDIAPWWHSEAEMRLINTYGPAECTPVSTINGDASDQDGSNHIGRGVGHVTWVVNPDNHNHLVPVGNIGELLLEGPLVGRGYLGDPDKTRASFIEDPPWLLKGSGEHLGRRGRLYKTGDLVRYQQDGTLMFIGRKDDQTKIRGQRVELGEVEYHLQQCMPDVTQSVAEVVSPQDNPTNPSLVAFVVSSKKVPTSTSSVVEVQPLEADIERKLAEILPSYMIPVIVFHVAEIPMTATGKTNRKLLRNIGSKLLKKELDDAQNKMPTAKRKPSNPMELQLLRIWSQVLNVPESEIGVEDSFFQLGGDSIASMQISSLARAMHIDITSTDVLRGNSISKVAAGLTKSKPQPRASVPSFEKQTELSSNRGACDFHLAPQTHDDIQEFIQQQLNQLGVELDEIEDIFPCSPLQQGVLAASIRDPLSYRAKFVVELVMNSRGATLDVSKLEVAWRDVVRRHALLRSLLVRRIGKQRHWVHVVLKKLSPSISFLNRQESTGEFKAEHESVVTYTKEGVQHHLFIQEID